MRYAFVDGTLYAPEQDLLVLADLHLGYEAELRSKGVYLQASEYEALRERLERVLEQTRPATTIINGDFKHSFGRISDAEWRYAKRVMDLFLEYGDVVLIAGNHDPVLGPLAESKGLVVEQYRRVEDALFLHGDALPPPDAPLDEVDTVVIGHEHPAITITQAGRSERVKCYLVGEWRGKRLVVLPSMFSLTEGTDVLSEPLHSPFLDDIGDFSVYAVSDGEVLPFGTVSDVAALRKA